MGGKGRPTRKADNLTATCEIIVYKMCEPQSLTNLGTSKVCYRDRVTFLANERCAITNVIKDR
jgi:hypothetical protein